VQGNLHAPFWTSGRPSDPPIDCDKLNRVDASHLPPYFQRAEMFKR
jgi:hypothetical protein